MCRGGDRLSILDLHTIKRIEHKFRIEPKLRQAVDEYREQVLHGTAKPQEGGGHSGTVSMITLDKAVKLADMRRIEVDGDIIHRPEDWIKVLDRTRSKFAGDLKLRLIEVRYHQDEEIDATCRIIGIDRSTYYNWREDLITYASIKACEIGLLVVK